jgi:hypothetical protein
MKTILIINNLVMAQAIVLVLLDIGNYTFALFAALSVLFAGFTQLIIATNYLNTYHKDKDRRIMYYFLGIALFLLLWISPIYNHFIWIIPPALSIYLTYILYRKHNYLKQQQ